MLRMRRKYFIFSMFFVHANAQQWIYIIYYSKEIYIIEADYGLICTEKYGKYKKLTAIFFSTKWGLNCC